MVRGLRDVLGVLGGFVTRGDRFVLGLDVVLGLLVVVFNRLGVSEGDDDCEQSLSPILESRSQSEAEATAAP